MTATLQRSLPAAPVPCLRDLVNVSIDGEDRRGFIVGITRESTPRVDVIDAATKRLHLNIDAAKVVTVLDKGAYGRPASKGSIAA